MADMFAPLVAQLKANPKTIVFTEGNDPRILEAASKLLAEGVLKVVMVGNEAECKAAAAAGNFDISAAEIIDPENYAGFDEMVNTMVELRKGKQTAEECTALLKKSNYFGTMLVKMGKADCLLGGATYSTADTIRPALQLVKTKKGAHLVSSCFILDRDCGEEGLKRIAMGDCAVNIDYTDTVDKATGEVKVSAASKLAEVAVETAKTAKLFGIDPKVAVLSFSTKGSGKGGTVALSHDATIKAQEMDPELAVDGELQFDAAVAPEVGTGQVQGQQGRRPGQHLHLPLHRGRQHRLQDRTASGRLRCLRPHPAGPERSHQRPVPRLQRRRGLQDEPDHCLPVLIAPI